MDPLMRAIEAGCSPVGLMTVAIVCGLALTLPDRGLRVGRRLILLGCGLYLVFLFTPTAEILVSRLEQPFPPLRHPVAGVRAVVVLGGYGADFASLPATNRISGETLARVVEGVRLSRQMPGAKLVFSGGPAHAGERPVAALMADTARALGAPETEFVIEGKSRTTYENLVDVKEIVGLEPFILVTSGSDLRRAMAVAAKLGMKPVAAPAAIWAAQHYPKGMSWREWLLTVAGDLVNPSTTRFTYLQRASHEYLGYAWYWLLGRV